MTEIGREVGGRYRLIELLGEGGMATIYRAHDSQLDRDVAVKILRPEYGGDPDFGARFRYEAQAAASLGHPNIVSVFDYGTDPAGPYIVMEYVDGEDLASLLRRNGPLPPRRAARLTADIARALEVAHRSGIVHRDVKPGNVLLTRDGRVKVADFGIARAFAEAQLTLPGTTLGSVHYFSPEQARGEAATAASDIYSLGIVLFELLAGRRPWEGDSAASIALARLTAPPPMVSAVRAGIPPVLEAIDRKALATDPADRFPTAASMADALEAFLDDRGVQPGLDPGVGVAGVAAAAAGSAVPRAAGLAAGAGGSGAGGAAAAGGVAAGAAMAGRAAAGVARPNPTARPVYPPDAYAGAGAPVRPVEPPRRYVPDGIADEHERSGGGIWPWVAGLLGLLILAGAGFLLVQYLNRGTPATAVQVSVPDFRGHTYGQAQTTAQQAGVEVFVAHQVTGTQPPQTVTDQDTPPGTQVDRGARIGLTIVTGPTSALVPDLRGKTEQAARDAIIAANLSIGTRREASDPLIPLGSVITQDPSPGLGVQPQTPVSYTVSTGPSPTPVPTPSPTPGPTPSPTPTPEPTPTPIEIPPTPSPPPPSAPGGSVVP